jgi:protein-tyrosine phosphatase
MSIADIHCHVLPCCDDGAHDESVSHSMLKAMYDSGVRTVFATPHSRAGMFSLPDDITERFSAADAYAKSIDPDFSVLSGTEFHFTQDAPDVFAGGGALTLAGSSYVLTEFSSADTAKYIADGLYFMRTQGFIPILAHAERCLSLVSDIAMVKTVVMQGAYIQINASSICSPSFSQRRFLRRMFDDGLVHFCASDSHNMTTRPPDVLARAYKKTEEHYGTQAADGIFMVHPSYIINDKEFN